MAGLRRIKRQKCSLARLSRTAASLAVLLLTLSAGRAHSAPFDYLLSPSASRIHFSIGILTPTTITVDSIREHSAVALTGGFGFEIPVHLPWAMAIDADLHDFAAYGLHTRFLTLSAGAKYVLTLADRRTLAKPLLTAGLGYLSDRDMPIQKKLIYIIRSGVDLNLATEGRVRWLVSSSVLLFPGISPGRPRVHLTPQLLLRIGLIM